MLLSLNSVQIIAVLIWTHLVQRADAMRSLVHFLRGGARIYTCKQFTHTAETYFPRTPHVEKISHVVTWLSVTRQLYQNQPDCS